MPLVKIMHIYPFYKRLPIFFRVNESLSKTINELKEEIEKLKGTLQEETNAKDSAVNEASQKNMAGI